MPAPIDEIKRKAIRRTYASGTQTIADIAKQFNVGRRTIERLCKDLREQKDVESIAVEVAIQKTVAVARSVNPDEMLLTVINDLCGEVTAVSGKSKEGLARSLISALEMYRKWNPPTTSELVDLAIAIPNFDPAQFARELRERLERSA